MPFSEKLKNLRAEHHMTQYELAKKMNLSRTTITGYETKNRQPSHEKLSAIADIFGVTVDYLIDASDDNATSYSLEVKHNRMVEQRLSKSFSHLSLSAKEEVLKHAQLLEFWEQQHKK